MLHQHAEPESHILQDGEHSDSYSYRKATSGSTRVARRAGIMLATITTAHVARTAITIARGSSGARPKRKERSKRAPTIASGNPNATPAALSITLSRAIIHKTCRGLAPSAMRTPNSALLRLTR